MNVIWGQSAPELYTEAMFKVPLWVGKAELSRNGWVQRVRGPVLLELLQPEKRVLFDPVRRANPYFHVMEFIWMMAGDNQTQWISQFNKGFKNYAEDSGLHHGAYGFRWREHFGRDQILLAVEELKSNPESRRCVLGMWDPAVDQNRSKKDLPCNTHIYLDVVDECLNMTVCNRSNDLFWGMLGSNLVHMTMLQELIARALGRRLGVYRVFTNNLHVYPDMPRFEGLWKHRYSPRGTYDTEAPHTPLLAPGEDIQTFLSECHDFIHAPRDHYVSSWLENVAVPMYYQYMKRLGQFGHEITKDMDWIEDIKARDWQLACKLWEEWHK